ncbi:hypothetical protein L0Y65_02510 [Candidatus Micrarchaeota archaeon]|nr:hypothetical protein [Candidatus Micrarchaeota archaeon]
MTTYGWVLLVLVIVIGVLFSTGILSPGYMMSEECNFGSSLKCTATLFNEAGHTRVLLTVFNGYPYKVRINDVVLQTQDGDQQFIGFSAGVNVTSGSNVTFEADLGGAPIPEGTIKRFTGNMTYVSCAPELGSDCSAVAHVASGRVTGRIIPN